MQMKKAPWLLLISFVFAVLLAGCSNGEKSAESEEPASKEEAKEEPKEEAAAEPAAPVAAVHNVEEIVKEKGKYSAEGLTEQQKQELQEQLKAAPEGMTGEEAYSLAVSLVAADIAEAAEKFENIDPVIQIDSSTPEDEIDIPEQETINVAILLDASGSMAAEVSGGQKMKLAKNAIQNYASDLPEGSNVMLRVYGHEGEGTEADKAMSCKSNEVVYDLGAYDEQAFTDSLEKFAPSGWTPLAGAIEAAEQDLQKQKGEHVQNVVYVVSDGIETCDGDPVAAAKSLSGSDIQAEVNIIGFDVDNEGQEQLEAVAKAGNGQYKSVYSESDLNEYLKQEYSRLYWEWLAWSNDRYFDILEQSNDIHFDLLAHNNDIQHKTLAAKNDMSNLKYDLQELSKFKDEEAASKYEELIAIRHETVSRYFNQEKDRKDAIRKEFKQKLEEKVKKLKEEKEGKYDSQ